MVIRNSLEVLIEVQNLGWEPFLESIMGKFHKPFHKKKRGILITTLLTRDGFNCSVCNEYLDRTITDIPVRNKMYITIDHIVRKVDGGPDHITNLRLLHQHCNNSLQYE